VTEELQTELDGKEDLFANLKIENDRLCTVNDRLISATEQAALVPGLQEEIQFLKRHYELEIGLVKESYENKLKS
jgi:hypothetical protein